MEKMGISLQPLSEMGATFYEVNGATRIKESGNCYLQRFEKFEGILSLKGDQFHDNLVRK